MKKVLYWTAVVAAALLLVGAVVYLTTMNPHRGSLVNLMSPAYPPRMEVSLDPDTVLNAEQVKEDLQQAQKLIRSRHPIWLLHEELGGQVDAAFEHAMEHAAAMTVEALQQQIMDCVMPLEDSHTGVLHRTQEVLPAQWTDPDFVDYRLDAKSNVGILTLHACLVNVTYGTALESFFQGVKDRGISNIVVDLRGNSGGNFDTAYLFLEYLDVESFRSDLKEVRQGWRMKKRERGVYGNNRRYDGYRGKIYVLTDRDTDGSALRFAALLADNGLAVVMGEAPKTMPDHYGEILSFRLKHSGLQLDVPYVHYGRIDETKTQQSLLPDFETQVPLELVYSLILQQNVSN